MRISVAPCGDFEVCRIQSSRRRQRNCRCLPRFWSTSTTWPGLRRRGAANGPSLRDEDIDELMLAGDVLPDWYDDWIVIQRERFRQARLHALRLRRTLVHRGRYESAIDVGLAAVAGEPLRESAHRAVILVHLAEGNRSEALRQYELCRRLLKEQLGLEPSPETERLRAQCGARDGAVMAIR